MINIQREDGTLLNRVETPAVVFDIETGSLKRIGEYEDMERYYEETVQTYVKADLRDVAKNLGFMELPADQELVDKVFTVPGYIKTLYNQTLNEHKK